MKATIIIDADSMIYSSALKETLNEAKECLDIKINNCLSEIQDLNYEIDSFTICSGSKGNFRKYIDDSYKANRKDVVLPEFLNELHKYAKTNWSSWYAFGVETDDLVASLWKRGVRNNETVIISSIDKDYLQFPCLMYNYNHKTLTDISDVDALRNFYTQMIVGDSADNIKVCKGKGKVFATKLLSDKNTKYEMIRVVFSVYKEFYKGKARERFINAYKLLKLRTDVLDR